MPHSSRKKFLKIPLKNLERDEKNNPKSGANNLKNIPSFCNSKKAKTVGDLPPKSTMNAFSGKSPLKSRNAVMDDLRTRGTSFLDKKVSGSHMDTKELMEKERVAPRFMSIFWSKGRLIKHKVVSQLIGRKAWHEGEEATRLPHAIRLQLFQALFEEPLPFLDLHARFGVSKRTIRGLVKNGFLVEEWGPKAIGVRFKLTNRGKMHLKELEAAARYEPKKGERNLIRLKYKV